MVRFGILGGLVAVTAVLTATGVYAKGPNGSSATGIHASIDLRTLS